MIEQAIAYAAIIWVALSWVKLVIKPEHKIYRFLCQKCITLWVTLAITFNPFIAAIAALVAALIDKHFSNTKITL